LDRADKVGLEDGPPTPIRQALFTASEVFEGDIPTEMDEGLGWSDDFGLTTSTLNIPFATSLMDRKSNFTHSTCSLTI
jgi:hypothetical protein